MRFESKKELMDWLEALPEDERTVWFAVGFTDEDLNEAIKSCEGRDATEEEKEHVLGTCIAEMDYISGLGTEDVLFWLDDLERQAKREERKED